MKSLSLVLLCISGCAFSAALKNTQALPLETGSLVYFQDSLDNDYVPAIEKGKFSKESGLSSNFYEMHQVTAQKINQDPEAQEIAVQLWDIVNKDPAYKLLFSNLVKVALNHPNSSVDSNESRAFSKSLVKMVNMITVLARKDIQLGLNQRGCYIRYPMQDLNEFLSLESDISGIMQLYEANKEFPAQKQKKLVWASALAQCYSTQVILSQLMEKLDPIYAAGIMDALK